MPSDILGRIRAGLSKCADCGHERRHHHYLDGRWCWNNRDDWDKGHGIDCECKGWRDA